MPKANINAKKRVKPTNTVAIGIIKSAWKKLIMSHDNDELVKVPSDCNHIL